MNQAAQVPEQQYSGEINELSQELVSSITSLKEAIEDLEKRLQGILNRNKPDEKKVKEESVTKTDLGDLLLCQILRVRDLRDHIVQIIEAVEL